MLFLQKLVLTLLFNYSDVFVDEHEFKHEIVKSILTIPFIVKKKKKTPYYYGPKIETKIKVETAHA